MKTCGHCRVTKPLADFHRRGRGYQTWCKPCRREYDRRYHASRRTRRIEQARRRHAEIVAWYTALKRGQPCVDCGGVFHHAAMTWDHLPGTVKLGDVSTLVLRPAGDASWQRSRNANSFAPTVMLYVRSIADGA
jgi:formate dehydrogenase assembly factor FdhD